MIQLTKKQKDIGIAFLEQILEDPQQIELHKEAKYILPFLRGEYDELEEGSWPLSGDIALEGDRRIVLIDNCDIDLDYDLSPETENPFQLYLLQELEKELK